MSASPAPEKDIARGRDRAPIRGWRAWGDAMPAPKRRGRRKRTAWIFSARRLPADEVSVNHVADGRPALDEGRAGNADRLLDALLREHGDQGRPDLADTSRARR